MTRLALILLAALAFPGVALAQTVTITSPNTVNPSGQPKGVADVFVRNADGTIATLSGGASGAQAQGSTTAGQSGPLSQCATVSGDQAYTIGTTNPLNCIANGRLKVGLSSAGNIDPAAQLATTLTADLIGCKYRTPVAWTVGFTGSLGCGATGALNVTGLGGGNIATAQIAVGTTATLIAAQRLGRQKIGVTVVGAVQCAFGAAGVTLATGWPLPPTAYTSDTWDTNAAVYAICASATTVGYREQF